MKKQILPIVLLLSSFLLTGCQNSFDKVIVDELYVDDFDEADIKDIRHYSLVEDGLGTPIKSQESGTCWVYAASTAMESSYKKEYNQDISIDPIEILENVYDPDKPEGYKLTVEQIKYDLGGWPWAVIETTSNGWGDYILTDAANYENTSIEMMKAGIMRDGAMDVSVNDAKPNKFGYYGDYYTLNDPDSDDFDHEVVLIGWDDDFPKENFKQQPKENGAWLAQNSRGDNWGKGGYYWISYETPFVSSTTYHISKDYKKVLAYDGGAGNVISTSDKTRVANIFHEKGNLKAVGTYTVDPNQTIIVEVCDEKLNKVIYRREACFKIPGYHTVKLNTPLEVENYAIAVTFESKAPVEGENWGDSLVKYIVDVEPGQSFVSIDDKWIDMSDEKIKELLGIDFVPNNVCIKAIY